MNPAPQRLVAPPKNQPKPQTALLPAEVELIHSYLGEETACQADLLKVLAEQEQGLVRHDLTTVKGALERAEPLLARIQESARRRARIFQTLGQRLPRNTPLRISSFVAIANLTERPRLESAIAALKLAAAGVRRQNAKNDLLIRTGLELQENLVRSVFGHEEGAKIYDKSARTKLAPPARASMSREF